nr:PREDICTED: ras-related protein Rab-7a-like [Latimeria chalumnae]|eukprot:XP_014347174.1 PREDICTED: ras-related protein Rab-7a-like [Latimeria chalumnae]
MLYRQTDCCLLVYDVSTSKSFHGVELWRKEFLIQANIADADADNFPFVVIGNKTDLEDRQVSHKFAKEWCNSNHLVYYETSAKDSASVEAAFQVAVAEALKRVSINAMQGWDAKRKDLGVNDQPNQIQLSSEEMKRDQKAKCAC